MKAIILEDEIIASNRLRRMINEVDEDIQILAAFTSIQDTASFLIEQEEQPHILFLDIHVLDGNSFELFNLMDISGKVIFTTAYDEYAVEAFRKNAIDYLLKPIKKDQLSEAIKRAKPGNEIKDSIPVEEGYKSRILIKFGSKIKSVKTEDIAYIYSQNKISYFYTHDGDRIPSDFKLQDLEEMLDPDLFFRLNRQFIAFIDSITKISTHNASRLRIELVPSIDEKIVVSTEKTRVFKKWIER